MNDRKRARHDLANGELRRVDPLVIMLFLLIVFSAIIAGSLVQIARILGRLTQ